jgi:hypothetical protein
MTDSEDRQKLFRYSYTWGSAIFMYILLWLAASATGYLFISANMVPEGSLVTNLVFAVVAATLAGGLGGATAVLERLSQRVAVDQTFRSERLLTFWIQPPVGAVLGLLTLLLIAIPGNLLINLATSGQMFYPDSFVSPTFTALQILLAWIAGFYQLRGMDWLREKLAQTTGEQTSLEAIDLNDPLAYKNWYEFHRQMRRWSYSWGIFIFIYALLWLVVLLPGLFLPGQRLESLSSSAAVGVILAAWPAIAAGGAGGVTNMLRELYLSVSYRQDFDRQRLMWYLVQPVIGAVLGGTIYLFVASGYFSIQRLFSPEASLSSGTIGAPSVIMIQLTLGWVVGFRQSVINQLILKLISDIVDFVKTAVQLLNPVVWFNKEERDKILTALGRKQGVFRAVDNEPDSTRSVWAD